MRNLLFALSGPYLVYGIFNYFCFLSFPAILRQENIGNDIIGLSTLLFLPNALVFIYAPFLEKFSANKEKILVLFFLIFLSFLFLTFYFIDVKNSAFLMTIILFAGMFLLMSAELIYNGVAIDNLKQSALTNNGILRTLNLYLGAILGTGGFLYLLSGFFGKGTYLLFGIFLFIFSLSFVFLPKNLRKKEKIKPSFIKVFKNKGVLKALLFSLVLSLTLKLPFAQFSPLMIDSGFDLEQVAFWGGVGAMVLGFFGTIFCVKLYKIFSVKNILLGILFLYLIIFCAFLSNILLFKNTIFLGVLFCLTMMIMSALYVGVFALTMQWCKGEQSASNFAFLRSFEMIIYIIISIAAGYIVEFGRTFNILNSSLGGYVLLFIISILLLFFSLLFVLPKILKSDEKI